MNCIRHHSYHIRIARNFLILLFFLGIAHQSVLIAQSVDRLSVSRSGEHDQPHTLIEVNTPASSIGDSLIAIVGVRLIDGLGGAPQENVTVLIDGNRINRIGPTGVIQIPDHTIVINGTGKSLLPGLIDAHLHTVNDDAFLEQVLKRGTTAFRDPGHPFRFYQVLDFRKYRAPRAFLTGSHLDGYPGVYKDHAMLVKSHRHAREQVERYIDKGSSGIKIYFRLPLEFYDPIINTAHRNGLPVFAHLELVDADDAIRAGVDGIEHVTSFGTALADAAEVITFKNNVRAHSSARRDGRYQLWNKLDLSTDRVREVIDMAARHQIVLSPTLTAFERQMDDPRAKPYEAQAFKKMLQFVGLAHEAGVKIVTGSHTSGWYADYGWAYQREMELLVEAGLTPLEVITSSTLFNAQYFRSESRIGSVEVGKLADLLLIDGDPSQDISAMRKIEGVMLNGVWLKKE